MDILVLAMYEEIYSTTLQCEGCESVLPNSVQQHELEARVEVSEVQFIINIGGQKKESSLGTLTVFLHLLKKCLSDFCSLFHYLVHQL